MIKNVNILGMMTTKNYHVFLKSKPGADGKPSEDNFGWEECSYPDEQLKDGEVIIQNIYLSVDPAQRCQMNDDTGVDYCKPWVIGQTIEGFMGVGKVLQSNHSGFSTQDLVVGNSRWPWKSYFKENMNEVGSAITKVPELLLPIVGNKPSLLLSLFGLVGCTAYFGIVEKGHIKPAHNQTLVISGAAGACGSLAGQIGRILGCSNVVGICGSDAKCKWLKEDLGFNSSINYKSEDVDKRLKDVCPIGIDVYFDNTGGDISDKVIKQMNKGSHVILCGQISQYNKDLPYPPPIPDSTEAIIKERDITRERYLVLSYMEKFPEALNKLAIWYSQGLIKVGETVEEGLQNTGRAFVSMMTGGNKGKQLVKVS